jgi:UDP-N-acetylglucosamine acyltransferase
MATVHPSAIVASGAELAEGVVVEPFAVIGAGVRVGHGARIGSHCVLEGDTEIGGDSQIGSHTVIGSAPQDVKYHGEPTRVLIGERTVIREFVSIHRASTGSEGTTSVGSDCYLMAYSHIAHDCRVGDQVVMANQATLGGHVTVARCATIGGLTGIHQFVRIGEYAFVGACSAVNQDIPPYVSARGNMAKPLGLNLVGLRRHGFPRDTIHALQHAYRVIFSPGLNTSQALARLEQEGIAIPEVQRLMAFIRETTRGVSQ